MNRWWRLFRYDWPLHFVLLLTNWLPDNEIFLRLRGNLSGLFLGKCGSNFRLARNVVFYNPSNIFVGSDVYLAYGCVLLAIGEIRIGDEVLFGPYVVLSAGNHTRENGSYRFGNVERGSIEIGRGVWVGSHVTVLCGARIGNGSLVGSNATVGRGVFPPDTLVVGVPGTAKKSLEG